MYFILSLTIQKEIKNFLMCYITIIVRCIKEYNTSNDKVNKARAKRLGFFLRLVLHVKTLKQFVIWPEFNHKIKKRSFAI